MMREKKRKGSGMTKGAKTTTSAARVTILSKFFNKDETEKKS